MCKQINEVAIQCNSHIFLSLFLSLSHDTLSSAFSRDNICPKSTISLHHWTIQFDCIWPSITSTNIIYSTLYIYLFLVLEGIEFKKTLNNFYTRVLRNLIGANLKPLKWEKNTYEVDSKIFIAIQKSISWNIKWAINVVHFAWYVYLLRTATCNLF